jgi:hypothetical protein
MLAVMERHLMGQLTRAVAAVELGQVARLHQAVQAAAVWVLMEFQVITQGMELQTEAVAVAAAVMVARELLQVEMAVQALLLSAMPILLPPQFQQLVHPLLL